MKTNRVLAQAWIDYDPSIVSINEKQLLSLSFNEQDKSVLAENENQALHGKSLEQCVHFLLALNSINYQYWDVENGIFKRYSHEGKVGALAAFDGFVKLFNRVTHSQVDYATITEADLFTNFGNIPDLHGRLEIFKESLNPEKLHQAWIIIEDDVAKRKTIDVDTAQKISEIMPKSFEDPYLKKIQLALYEIAQVYLQRGYEIHCDVTVAADYQIPKVLEGMGVLAYSPELKKKIDSLEIIEQDSEEEKALRAATIIACEQISSQHNIAIPALDRQLWLARNDFKDKQFHLTKTSRY